MIVSFYINNRMIVDSGLVGNSRLTYGGETICVSPSTKNIVGGES